MHLFPVAHQLILTTYFLRHSPSDYLQFTLTTQASPRQDPLLLRRNGFRIRTSATTTDEKKIDDIPQPNKNFSCPLHHRSKSIRRCRCYNVLTHWTPQSSRLKQRMVALGTRA